jgi:ABC-type multidrug transport system fused ATPase/permease subunit
MSLEKGPDTAPEEAEASPQIEAERAAQAPELPSNEQTAKQLTRAEFKRGIRAIWSQARSFRRELWALLFLGLLSAAANGAVPYVTGRFFDTLIALSHGEIQAAHGLPLWGLLLGAWTAIQLVANNSDWVMDRVRRTIDTDLQLQMQVNGFSHLFRLPISYHKGAHMNGVLQKISQASWRVSSILRTVIMIAPQFLSVALGIALAASINGLLASVLALGVFSYVLLLIKILMPIAAIDSAAHRAWNESWDDAAASVMQIESVKQAAAEQYEDEKMRAQLLGRARGLWHQLERTWSNVSFFQRTIVFITQLVIFALSIHLVGRGVITVGELVAFNGYSMMFFGPFVQLGYSWQTIQNGISSAAHAQEVFDEAREIYEPAASAGGRISGAVTFDRVSFSYGPSEPPILMDVSFAVEPGEVVALVGASGVGKSTTVSLISGYYFPSKGSVYLDGTDTREFPLTPLRSQIAVVPQEVALFNDTIEANIRYGSFEATNEEVRDAAVRAHIADFITGLPRGYETAVGERGIKLSVGQKQRIAIARAILRDPRILVLDEPTSALDARTESLITESLEELMRGRTTFIIAHRLSTVRKANRIFVFDQGRIIEEGTHEHLISIENGAYRRLYEYQIGLHA